MLVFAYSGWVLYSRQADNARIAEEAERKEAIADGEVVDKIGGGQPKGSDVLCESAGCRFWREGSALLWGGRGEERAH